MDFNLVLHRWRGRGIDVVDDVLLRNNALEIGDRLRMGMLDHVGGGERRCANDCEKKKRCCSKAAREKLIHIVGVFIPEKQQGALE